MSVYYVLRKLEAAYTEKRTEMEVMEEIIQDRNNEITYLNSVIRALKLQVKELKK